MKRAALSLIVLSACATTPRFADRPVVTRVDDTRDIPKPTPNTFYAYRYMADSFAFRSLTRAMELRTSQPAWSTNALDEVPDSTWFTNRVTARDVSPEEAAVGPGASGPPELPFVIVSGKSGGGNPGFVVKDATGRRFLVKFDPRDNPKMQTATDAIVSRLFWLMGWNVPADHVIVFAREELSIANGAKAKDALGRKEPLTEAVLDATLATSPRRADGRYRALASEFVPGEVLGGIVPEGVREDDANDTIPHEHRRELRGLLAPAAWLNHTDMKEDNLLDTWVEQDGRHFVRHYLVDFGEALGAHAAEKGRREDGYEYFVDWTALLGGTFSFGLWIREWESLESSPWLSIGAFATEPFDPYTWHEAYPFWPFDEADAADRYWGAKQVLAVRRDQLEAIVATGALSKEASEYLVETLLDRQRQVGAAFLEAVSPLDHLRVEGGAWCGVDLGVAYDLADHGVVEVLHPEDRTIEEPRSEVTVHDDGAFCVPLTGRGYTVYRVRTRRGGALHPVMQVHVIEDDAPRIVGVVRVEPAE